METTVKMVQKEVMVEYCVGVPTVNKKGELIFTDSTEYVPLNIFIPEELAEADKEYELKKWFSKKWEESNSDIASVHSIYLEEHNSW